MLLAISKRDILLNEMRRQLDTANVPPSHCTIVLFALHNIVIRNAGGSA